jgi:hypothetical protein
MPRRTVLFSTRSERTDSGMHCGETDTSRINYCTDIRRGENASSEANASTPMQSNLRSTTRLRATAPSNPTSATRVLIDQNSLRLQDACIRTRVVLPPVRIPWDNARETANGTRIVAQECFAFSAIPTNPSGCIGGDKDRTTTDYCTYSAPVVAPVQPPTADDFRLKMYWDNYYWQESFDRVWCIQCKNGCQEDETCFCITVRGIRRALTLSMLRQIKFRFGSSTRTCVWSDPAMQLL